MGRVKLNMDHHRILNGDMLEWMERNKDKTFWVERVMDGTVKLRKVDFWISEDLLVPVGE